jgi:transcriptional regulator of acetoin/glycerol metabolism
VPVLPAQPAASRPAHVAAAPAVPVPAAPIEPAAAAPAPADMRTLEEAEIAMIRAALDAAGGNISEASKRLGISRNTIYRKLRWNKPG